VVWSHLDARRSNGHNGGRGERRLADTVRVPLTVRIPKDVYDWLAAKASMEDRKFNDQVVKILRDAMKFERGDSDTGPLAIRWEGDPPPPPRKKP
jgi:hypothetical protein